MVNDVDGTPFVDTRGYETAAEIASALKDSQTREGATSAPADSESLSWDRMKALDTLGHAIAIAKFIQGITILPGRDNAIHLSPNEITGLFFVMNDMISRLDLVEELLSQSVAQGVRHG